jgi:deazaflavin-dependent oxidoreductase (nitroreductase family)
MSGPSDFNQRNQRVVEAFRANGGKVSGWGSLMLLTTTGAKSGKERVNPLAYSTDGDRIIVVGSKGGAPSNPDWYFNLVANPIVTVEVNGERYQAQARVTEGAERERLFKNHVALLPNFADYQNKTDRQLPVIVLERLN